MGNEQKTPLSRTLPVFAQKKALDEIAKRGLALPGHVTAITGQIVTVAFDVTDVVLSPVQMPVASSAYVQLPIQIGDRGVAFPASVNLATATGLGAATSAPSTFGVLQGNLSTLVWFPIANVAWNSGNPNAVVIAGPGGVVLKDTAGTVIGTFVAGTFTLSANTTITVQVGGVSIVISSAGVSIQGVEFPAHTHSPGTFVAGDTPVTGVSGPVT